MARYDHRDCNHPPNTSAQGIAAAVETAVYALVADLPELRDANLAALNSWGLMRGFDGCMLGLCTAAAGFALVPARAYDERVYVSQLLKYERHRGMRPARAFQILDLARRAQAGLNPEITELGDPDSDPAICGEVWPLTFSFTAMIVEEADDTDHALLQVGQSLIGAYGYGCPDLMELS